MSVSALKEYWAQLERERGLPPGYLAKTRQIESAGNRMAVSSTGATGPFQFTKGTARAMGLPLTARTDEVLSARAAADLAAQNKSILAKALRREPSGAELYMAHQQGGGGAAALLSNPGKAAGSLVPARNIAVNAGDPNAPASSILQKFINKYNQTQPGQNTGQGPTVAAAANLAPPAPVPSPVPALPAPVMGAGKGLLGLLQSGGSASSFMSSPEMAASLKNSGMLAAAIGGETAKQAPLPLTGIEDAHIPDLTLLERLKRKKGLI